MRPRLMMSQKPIMCGLERCANEMNWCHAGRYLFARNRRGSTISTRFRNSTACRGIDLAAGLANCCRCLLLARMRPTGRADRCPQLGVERTQRRRRLWAVHGRVGMWRGGCRPNISVSAPFVWRCALVVQPVSTSRHRTGQADLPHPALGQDFTPSLMARRAQARLDVRARSTRKDAGVDRPRPGVV